MTIPALPPLFDLHVIADGRAAADHALALAAGGADPATVVWTEREDVMETAIVLAPETSLDQAANVLFCGGLGLADALAAVIPAGVDVALVWPGRVLVNEREAGTLSLRAPARIAHESVPDWLVIAAEVRVTGTPPEDRSGQRSGWGTTTLDFERCGEIGPADLLEAFCRHFLVWVNRFQDDGFEPVRAAWHDYGRRAPKDQEIRIGRRHLRGSYAGLGPDGALLLSAGENVREIPLLPAIGL